MSYLTSGFRPIRYQLRLEGGVEIQTTAAAVTLDGKSSNYQSINASAAIDLNLPAEEDSNGLVFSIAETGGANAITVKNDAGGTVATVAASGRTLVGCDGSAWAVVG